MTLRNKGKGAGTIAPTRSKRSRDYHQREKDAYEKTVVEIEIPFIPPTENQWERMHWGKKTRLKEKVYKWLWANHRNTLLPCPCTIVTRVFKKNPKRGDAHNLTTPVDKLFLDALTNPRGRKTRGLGLLPDDSSDYVILTTPSIHSCKDGEERTVMRFEPMKGRKAYG